MAELLRKGVAAAEDQGSVTPSVLTKDRKTGLPVIECRKAAAWEVTPERAAEILLAQDLKWNEEAGR